MNKQKTSRSVRAAFTGLTATFVLVASALPALVGPQTVFAGQVTSRSITMSSSTPGASSTYTIQWNPGSTTNIQQVDVDFCSNSPIPSNSTCTAPTGFAISGTTPTATETGGLSNSGACTWTAAGKNLISGSNYRTLEITDASGCAQATGTADTITLSGVTNPTTSCSTASACEFYARIITFSTTGTYTPGTLTNSVDYGGVALSTASTINLSATVQESINFCVYTSTCGTTPVNVVLGHTVGSATVIDSTTVDTSSVNYSLSTNASHGASVSVLGSTLTDAASQTIPALTTAGSITAGTADFGLCLTLPAGMTVQSPYTNVSGGCTSSSTFVYTATASTATPVASTAAPINGYAGTLTYGVTASNTTPTGIYTATHQLIATGTF